MLLDQTDIEELFEKKCCCFGAAVAIGGTTLAGATVGGVASGTILAAGMGTAANLALIGTVVSTVGMIQQGQAQGSQAAFQAGVSQNNAIIAQQQATRARQQARIDSQDYSRQQSDLMATRNSLFNGTVKGRGSNLYVSTDLAGESKLNAMRIMNQGEVNSNRLQQEVMNQKSQAGLYGMQGRQAVKNSYYQAGGNLFQTGSKIWGMKA
jgi:hypothetical protein